VQSADGDFESERHRGFDAGIAANARDRCNCSTPDESKKTARRFKTLT
jgi:ribosome modulation factor